MVQIAAFKGWRYASDETDISTLCAPPYDVLTTEERDALAAIDEHCVVELELAHGSMDIDDPDSSFQRSKNTWTKWVEEGIVKEEAEPAIYVLEQEFDIDGVSHNRISFIVEMKLYAFDERVVLPHEHTLPKTVDNVFNLINTSRVNYSQVFGLYQNATSEYDELVALARAQPPAATAVDAKGVRSTLHVMTDPDFIARTVAMLDGEEIFIADGHHRYTVGLRLRDFARAAQEEGGKTECTMIALTNMDDPQLAILGYHRAVKAEGEFDANAFCEAISEYFDIRDGNLDDLNAFDGPGFLMGLAGQPLKLVTLKPDVDLDKAIANDHCMAWKELDVSILHELVIWPQLGVSTADVKTLERIAFSDKSADLLARLEDGRSDVVFILRPTRMDQLRSITLEGEVLPQKATFFYPKLPSGMVFRSMR